MFKNNLKIVLLDDAHSPLGEEVAALAVRVGYTGRLVARRLPNAFIPHGKRADLYREFLVDEVLIPGPGRAQ